ncbi:hypothetical protein F5Y06DRAFT_106884 [Hypoxylon sp. FL0890]|nr:hypothetical protein F5Y06DRAFT_106884 [Hypoxylon sp. FL0890]
MEHSEAPKDHGHDGQTSTRLSSRNIRPRPGDWTCPACGFLNFRNRRICFSCSRPEPVIPRDKRDFDHVNSQSILIPTAQYGGNHYESIHRNGTHIPSPPGEWVCGNVVCGCRNFAEYIHCYRCRGQRLGTGGYFRDILVAWIAKPDLVAIIYRKFVGWLQVDIDVKQESVQAYNTPRYPGTGSGAYNTGQLYPCNSRFEEYTAEPPSPLPSQRSGTGRDVWQALYNAQPASVAQQGYSGQQAYPPQQAAYTPQWYYCGADSHLVPSHYNTIPIRHENHSTQRYSSQDLDQPLKFGCPFHKAYPHRFPCCRERSLRDTSRVKEHIYRSHLVFQCTRCGGTFPEKMAWESHQRSNPACKSVDHGPVKYAINQQQREILRSRKGLKGTSEPDRWFQIYKMVCPEAVPPYPSPCKLLNDILLHN